MRRMTLIIGILLAVAAWATTMLAQTAAPKPVYEVYALRYAVLPDFPVAGLVQGANSSRRVDIAMMMWLIRGNGRNILVDSGFYHDQFFKQWKVKDFVKPSDLVAQTGVKPEGITDVIITHMHWDHADGMDLFPKAKIWIQKDEYTYYTGEAWQQPRTHGGIDPDDVMAIVKLNTQGHVALVNGDAQEIMPGITCYKIGRHTWQSQYVSVNSRAGKIVLASDNMYLYENLETHAPIAATLDAGSNLRAQDRMKQMAADPKLIIPGHDLAVFERFPKVSEKVVRID